MKNISYNYEEDPTKEKIREELNFLKFDNEFNEIKIRHIIFIYAVTIIIVMIALIFMLANSGGEISDSNVNNLSLLARIVLFIMLIYKIKPSKKELTSLYKDFKNKLNIKEIIFITVFFTCLNIGGTKITIDIVYLISPSFATEFMKDCPLIINSMTDYWICFIILVILSPVIDEIIFRNVLFKRLSKKFNIYVGLIVSSIFFSALNICPEMIGALVLGIINCMLYIKYRNILLPMCIYFINACLYMLASIPLEGMKYSTIILNPNDIVLTGTMGTILFTIGIIFFAKFIIDNRIYLREDFNRSRNIGI